MENSKEARVDFLMKVPLLKTLASSPEAISLLADLMQLRKCKAGETLLLEGQVGDEFFVLTKGSVSVYRKTPEGDQYKVVILKSEFHPALGEGGLIEAEPRSATVICEEDCQLLVLTRENFAKFSESKPEWALPILKAISLQLMARIRQTSRDVMLLHKALMNEIRG
jgi:CRP-like cAMP-binding protein